jgi:hypothetical protein
MSTPDPKRDVAFDSVHQQAPMEHVSDLDGPMAPFELTLGPYAQRARWVAKTCDSNSRLLFSKTKAPCARSAAAATARRNSVEEWPTERYDQ